MTGKPKTTPLQHMIGLAMRGTPLVEIARLVGAPPTTVAGKLKKAGVSVAESYSKKDLWFATGLSESFLVRLERRGILRSSIDTRPYRRGIKRAYSADDIIAWLTLPEMAGRWRILDNCPPSLVGALSNAGIVESKRVKLSILATEVGLNPNTLIRNIGHLARRGLVAECGKGGPGLSVEDAEFVRTYPSVRRWKNHIRKERIREGLLAGKSRSAVAEECSARAAEVAGILEELRSQAFLSTPRSSPFWRPPDSRGRRALPGGDPMSAVSPQSAGASPRASAARHTAA